MRSIRRSSKGVAGRAAIVARPIAALLIAAGWVATSDASAASLDVDAAWSGLARPGRSTELRIRVSSPAPGTATLHVEAGRIVIETTVAVQPGSTAQLSLPIPATDDVRVDATLPGRARLHRELALRLTEEPLIALSAGSSADLPEGLALAQVDASGFPSDAEAYEAVDAVAIDDATLAHLDAAQLRALVGFIERCGPTLAVGMPQGAAALLRADAGCGGRALVLLPDTQAMATAVEAALGAAPSAEPSAASLRTLLPSDSRTWPLVVAALAVYFGGAVLLTRFARRNAILVGYALASTVVAATAGRFAVTKPQIAIWAESDSADRWGRYTGLAELVGSGRAVRSLALPALLEGAEPCADIDPAAGTERAGADSGLSDESSGAAAALWRWDARRARYASVTFHQTLLGADVVCWHGSFPLARAASLDSRPDRALAVTNRGGAAWPPGIAVRAGARYLLPPIAPRATEVLAPTRAKGPDSPAAELAVLRADGAGALLWPLELPPLGFDADSVRAYLLLQAGGAKDAG